MPGIAQQTYLEDQILGADPLELVCLLYRGTIESVRCARTCVAENRIADRGRAISKALAILVQLSGSLDHTVGNPLSRNLAELYDYMQRRLLEANLQQKAEPLAEVEGLLATLSEAWEHAWKSGVRREPDSPAAVARSLPAEADSGPCMPAALLAAQASCEYSARSWSC
jgi:flagellar protein FliS